MSAKTSDYRPGPTLCRCCFADGCYKDISTEYFWMGKREVYSEMLTETFSVSIGYQSAGPNSNSRLICEACIARLRDASDFKRQVQECEKTFMQHLDPSGSLVDMILESDREVKLETGTVKLKDEKESDDDYDDVTFGIDDMDDDDDDLDDQPLTAFKAKVPKKEVVEIIETAKPEKRKAPTKLKVIPTKKLKKKEAPKPTPSKAPVAEKKDKKKDVDPELEAVKRNALLILRNSTAYPFLQGLRNMRCAYCGQSFEDPDLLRSHLSSEHCYEDRALAIKADLTQLKTRVDITDLTCKLCSEAQPTIDTLATHLNTEHNIDIDFTSKLGLVQYKLVKDNLSCFQCGEKAIGLYQLYRHTNSHFHTLICDVCGKNFESLGGFNTHIQNHVKKFYCARCKTEFDTAADRREHYLTSVNCRPIKCPYCSERFGSVERKDAHLVEAHNKPKKIYKCKGCDKEFNNRNSLGVHYKSTHTELHKCDFCDATFASPPAKKMYTYKCHTNERPYQCDVCKACFFNEYVYKRHKIHHDESKRIHCVFCSKSFYRKDRLKRHVDSKHQL